MIKGRRVFPRKEVMAKIRRAKVAIRVACSQARSMSEEERFGCEAK